ncbi:MAG TPA: hypothetical protein VHD32_02180 [Candidatus Didemnitutus sp.]|nr:hypothetical protein [Candidatus Didemnitutus sp.]
MSEFLRQLGYSPFRYELFAGIGLTLWLVSAFLGRPGREAPRRVWESFGLYAVLLLAAMLAFRWPTFFYKPVNPDEGQYIAATITMVDRHVFWWPDTMTSGPVTVAPLALAAAIGLPADFVTARIVGLLFSWGIALCVMQILRHLYGDRLGRLLTVPLAGFLILLEFWDFTPYVSEWCPLFLSALAAALVTTSVASDGRVRPGWRLIAAGLVLGILPFSKLQVAPLGAAIGVWTIAMILAQPSGAARARPLAQLLGATFLALSGMILWLWSSGSGPHFYEAFVRHNLIYAQARALPWTASFGEFRYLADFAWGFALFHQLLWVFLLAGLGMFAWRRIISWRPASLAIGLLIISYYASLAPGRAYPHYLLLVIFPLALATGVFFGGLLEMARARAGVRLVLLGAFAVGPLAWQVGDRVTGDRDVTRLLPDHSPRTAIIGALGRLHETGDTLAVWGWRPEIYVESGLPQATRDSLTERQMSDNPMRDYFRAEFLADVTANRPAFIVDAVGPGGFIYQDRNANGVPSFPALAAYLAREYQAAGEFNGFALYVRRDRWRPETQSLPSSRREPGMSH